MVFIASSPRKHQTEDDADAARGPRGGPGGLEREAERLLWRIGSRTGPRSQLLSPSGLRLRSSQRRGRGQGGDLHHQVGPPGQGHEHQVPGDLPLLPALKESEITDPFLGESLKEEALKIRLVQKRTRAG